MTELERENGGQGQAVPMIVTCDSLPVKSYGFINTVVADFENAQGNETGTTLVRHHVGSSAITVATSWLTSPRGPLAAFPSISAHEADDQLLSYYLSRVCPLTVPVPRVCDKSPFSCLVFPFAACSSSSTLMQSILCLAACHRARENSAFESMALAYSGQALHLLRTRIPTLGVSHLDRETHAELIVSMMLLCQSEIIRSCDERWVVHLRGARHLAQLRPSSSSSSPNSAMTTPERMIQFAERYFAFQDVMGRTACGEEPIFGTNFWLAQQDETDLWLGCSPNLVSIISTITEMNWKYHHCAETPVDSSVYREEVSTVRRRLESLKQHTSGGLDNDDDHTQVYLMQAAAEAKHLAVRVYFHTALAGSSPSSPLVKCLIQQILRLTHVLLASNAKAGLTWPLFVAAVQLDKSEELEWIDQGTCSPGIPYYARPFILSALDQMSDGLANVGRLRSIIEKVWRAREMSEGEGYDDHGKMTSDWARFVSPFCQNMSLA